MWNNAYWVKDSKGDRVDDKIQENPFLFICKLWSGLKLVNFIGQGNHDDENDQA